VLPDTSREASSLYDKLEDAIVPLDYGDNGRFIDVMRHCIALSRFFLNAHRMMQQYVLSAYFL